MALRICFIQWNLGNSNANFSKLPDFSKMTDGLDFFHYNFLQKISSIFRISIFRKNQFFEQIIWSQSKKFLLKSPAKFEIPKLPVKVTHGDHDFFARRVRLLHTRVTSRVYSPQVADTVLTVNILNIFVGPNQRNFC